MSHRQTLLRSSTNLPVKRAAAFIAVLVACTSAAAESFSASSIQADWASLQAAITVLEYRHDDAGDTFRLDAQAIRLESDSTRWLAVGEIAYGTREPQTETRHFAASNWTATAWDPDSNLFVIGHDATLETLAGSGKIRAPTASCIARPTYFASPRPADCPSTTSLVDVEAVAQSWVLRGNFTIALWAWEGHAENGSTFWSGSRPTSNNIQSQGEIEMRVTFLFVTEGVLRLEPKGGPLHAYSSSVDIRTESPAIVSNGRMETGNVSGIHAQSGVHVQRLDDGLRIDAKGATLIGPAPGSSQPFANWPLGALGMAVLLAPILGVTAWRYRILTHFVLAGQNLDLHNHDAAARHAKIAIGRSPLRVRACVIGAVACIKGGDLEQAERFLLTLHGVRWHDEAGCRLLWAHLRIRQGRVEEGQALLEEALRHDASYAADAIHDPLLGPHMDPSAWPRAA